MSFDLLAPHYRWLEFVLAGNKLQRCRTAYLAEFGSRLWRGPTAAHTLAAASPVSLAARTSELHPTSSLSTNHPPSEVNHILLLGEGNGRFLVECRRRLKEARITCVDASASMLKSAGRRLLHSGLGTGRTEFVHADVLHWTPPRQKFDLIVTHFFLDCFQREQLECIVAKLAAAASPQAGWWLADFRIPPRGLPRWRAAAIHHLMYGFFRVVTRLPARELTPPDDLLRAQGFVLCERRLSEWGLLHSDHWQRETAALPSFNSGEKCGAAPLSLDCSGKRSTTSLLA